MICFLENLTYTRIVGILQGSEDFTWRLSDCEELVGGIHRRWWGYFWD